MKPSVAPTGGTKVLVKLDLSNQLQLCIHICTLKKQGTNAVTGAIPFKKLDLCTLFTLLILKFLPFESDNFFFLRVH